MCALLNVMDVKIILVVLTGLEDILRLRLQESKACGGDNTYAIIIEECYGLDRIEVLQSHENMEIYQKALGIIERYFGSEEENASMVLSIDEQRQQYSFHPEPQEPSQGFQF